MNFLIPLLHKRWYESKNKLFAYDKSKYIDMHILNIGKSKYIFVQAFFMCICKDSSNKTGAANRLIKQGGIENPYE